MNFLIKPPRGLLLFRRRDILSLSLLIIVHHAYAHDANVAFAPIEAIASIGACLTRRSTIKRSGALDVRITLGCELFDGGMADQGW